MFVKQRKPLINDIKAKKNINYERVRARSSTFQTFSNHISIITVEVLHLPKIMNQETILVLCRRSHPHLQTQKKENSARPVTYIANIVIGLVALLETSRILSVEAAEMLMVIKSADSRLNALWSYF